MHDRDLWNVYRANLVVCEELGLSVDTSRILFPEDFWKTMEPRIALAFDAMASLEGGEIANKDENRRVGHYWLRAPELAPEPELTTTIGATVEKIRSFAARVHQGSVRPEQGEKFRHVLVVGIGGSALGPQLAAAALATPTDAMTMHFFDNTDPDGMDGVLARLGGDLAATLTVVISKSGGTKETRNGMLEARAAYERAGLTFARAAIAVTGEGSELDGVAVRDAWLARFPMYDWVGGRTSETSAVGLLPAALQGVAIDELLDGARAMDVVTRQRNVKKNPAAMLALAWWQATAGRGEKDMVILPYKDRLGLLSRYLQQLIMESLGKERDRGGKVVHQGISVYGNKGSTDQHAYVQQLREGVPNFFATFVEVLQDRRGPAFEVEPGVTSGDYLVGFLLGTRRALFEKGRGSITLTLDEVSPRSFGALLALFERTVGLYGELVNVNAYHQPGVEAGKQAAADVLALQRAVVEALTREPASAEAIATRAGQPDGAETTYKILEHLAANPGRGVCREGSRHPDQATFRRGLNARCYCPLNPEKCEEDGFFS